MIDAFAVLRFWIAMFCYSLEIEIVSCKQSEYFCYVLIFFEISSKYESNMSCLWSILMQSINVLVI